MDDSIFGEIMDMKSAHEIWIYLNEKYGTISDDDDEPKEEAREDVEHDHNTMVVEDCSTSWLSDDDDRPTTSSLGKIDGDASSDAIEDATPCILDSDDDGSCPDDILLQAHPLHHIASCHKVTLRYLMLMWLIMLIHNEFVSRLDSMTMSLRNEMAKNK
jgi:hypothetical protein